MCVCVDMPPSRHNIKFHSVVYCVRIYEELQLCFYCFEPAVDLNIGENFIFIIFVIIYCISEFNSRVIVEKQRIYKNNVKFGEKSYFTYKDI